MKKVSQHCLILLQCSTNFNEKKKRKQKVFGLLKKPGDYPSVQDIVLITMGVILNNYILGDDAKYENQRWFYWAPKTRQFGRTFGWRVKNNHRKKMRATPIWPFKEAGWLSLGTRQWFYHHCSHIEQLN